MRIPASDFGNRPGYECLQDLDIEVRQALEVQTGLAHFVFSEPGQELGLPGVVYAEVDDELSAADCEASKRCVARVATLVPVSVRAIAHDAWPPHVWLQLRNPPAHGHDGLAVRQLLGAGSGRKVSIDARARGFGLGLSHRKFLISGERNAAQMPLLDDYGRTACGYHQHAVALAKHLVVKVDSYHSICSHLTGTLL